MTVFKIFIHGMTDTSNLVFRSDVSTALTGYGDSILSPKLKRETNKADSFEFIILPINNFYNSFEKKKTFVYLTRDDKCIFRGRVSDVKTDIYKQRTISCEGDLAFLADSVQPPNKKSETTQAGSTKKKKHRVYYSNNGGISYTSEDKNTLKMTPEAYFRKCIDVHNGQMPSSDKKFTVGSVTVTDKGKSEYFERTSYQDTSSVISSDLLSVYGGVLRTRYENGQAYIDWLDAYTETNSQQINFGVNMIDLDQEPPTDEYWTVLLPTGEENCTIESVNNDENGAASKFLKNQDAIAQYGYIVHHHSFNNAKKPSELLAKAQKYMSTHCKLFPNNLIVKAIDLQLIGESSDPLELGDKIQVVSTPHGLNTTMACIAMELDIFNPENNSYTIGTILPPDKEKKKEPISEKQKNSHHSSSRGIANNANAISGLQNDVNVNANNINVNAENIAVNALNIAVNAENIAVVAKNIAIAADTIDIKAQQITKTFTDETGTLSGTIEESAAGIKSTFSDNTTGLSSYFSQEAGKIVSEVKDTKTDVYTKITQTETSITREFNNKIYGENGLTYDYQRKITETAAGTIDEMYATLYGVDENGNPINPDDPNATPLGFYKRVRDEAVDHSVDSFHKELYGEGGTSTNPKSGSVFDAVYTKTATYSREYFQAQLYGSGDNDSVNNPGSNTILRAVYNHSAAEWKNELWGSNGSKDNPDEGSILYGTRQEIGAKVSKGDVEAGFKVTANGVKLFGKEISLEGWVKVDKLSAVNGDIANLVNGNTTASYILATKMKVASGNFYLGDSNNTSGKLYYHGTEYYGLTVSMPGVTGSFTALGLTYSNGSYQTSFNLNHSHSCTTNDSDGTITLGGAVAAGSGGSFKIADTKAYKDGVSAATNSVTITSVNKDPDASVEYDSDRNKYTVPLKAVASNLNSKTAKYTFFATAAYNAGSSAGQASVTISSLGRQQKTGGEPYDDTYTASSKKYTIHATAKASNGATLNQNIELVATEAYNGGYNAGNTDGVNSVTITSLYKDSAASVTYDSTNNKYTIPLKAVASNSASRTGTYTFLATDAYNTGYTTGNTDGVNSVTITSIGREPAESGVRADVYNPSTKKINVYTQAVASNGAKKNQHFLVSGNEPYNAGASSVTITSLTCTGEGDYDPTLGGLPITISGTASNLAESSETVYISASSAYNAGSSAGYQDGYQTVGVNFVGRDPTKSDKYTASSHAMTVYLKATAQNGNEKTDAIDVSCYTAYQDGKTDGYDDGYGDGAKSIRPADVTIEKVTVFATGKASVRLTVNGYTANKSVDAENVTDNHT